jgi:hypothetical protein
MSRPVIKIAKPGRSVIGLSPKDFALNTKYALPKIYKQVTVEDDTIIPNPLGYPHGAWCFRRLNKDSYYSLGGAEPASFWEPYVHVSGPILSSLFTGNEYTCLSSTSSGSLYAGATVRDNEIEIRNLEHIIGYDGGTPIYGKDTSISTALFAEPLGETDKDITVGGNPVLKVAPEGRDVKALEAYRQNLDGRFDTLKIFKTGELTLSLPEETIPYMGDCVVRTATFNHGLGYPPMYFPPATVNMNLSTWGNTHGNINERYPLAVPGFGYDFSTVDVYVDSNNLYIRSIRASNGPDAFGSETGPRTHPALTLSLHYTLFYNEIGSDFDLLTN